MQKHNYSPKGKAQIKVLKMVVTTEENYFAKYDIVSFNFKKAIVGARPSKNEDGTYTIELIPAGEINGIDQFDTLEFEGTTNILGEENYD